MNRIAWIAGLAGAMSLVGGCQDQDKDRVTQDTAITGPTATSGMGKDAEFLRKASIINETEIELGQLAQQKGTHPDVQRYGAMLAKDHGENQNKLKQLADTQKVDLPAKPDREHQQLIDRLSRLESQEFDRQFIAEMIKGHEKAVAAFEEEMRTGQDPQAKRFAADTLPHLRHHLQFAREVQTRISGEPAPMAMPEDRMQDGGQKDHNMHDEPGSAVPPR